MKVAVFSTKRYDVMKIHHLAVADAFASLKSGLGVQPTVMRRSRSIVEHADSGRLLGRQRR